MNKKISLLMAYVFVIGQVFAPVAANAQTNTASAKVVVSDDLQAQRAGKSSQETSLYQGADENEALNKRVSVNINNITAKKYKNIDTLNINALLFLFSISLFTTSVFFPVNSSSVLISYNLHNGAILSKSGVV